MATTPNGRAAESEVSDGKHREAQVNLLEQILSRETMSLAWKRVKANNGVAGMDGMSVDVFLDFARQHWERIRSALYEGTYWKQWKRPRTRRRHLLALGIPRDEVKLATRSRKGYGRMAGNSVVQRALTKQWLWDQVADPDERREGAESVGGRTCSMRQQWVDLHYPTPSGVG